MPNISFVGAKKRKVRHSRLVPKMEGDASTQPQQRQNSLLSLVDELLLSIIDQIDSHETLCNLAATCSRFQSLTEPYIWRSLLVLKGIHAQKIAIALDSKLQRASYVQDLSIRYKDQFKEGIEELGHFMQNMDKLRHLTVESPCPNNTEWREGLYFDSWTRLDYTSLLEQSVYPRGPTPTLPILQSLTLHGHGVDDRKFVFGRTAIMFFHPTLRDITISCVNFDANITLSTIPPSKLKSTPLRSLTLIECNVNVPFLDVILSLPKALKKLSIGERLHTFPECQPSRDPTTRTSSPLFLSALLRQADSLEHLTHVGGQTAWLTPLQVDPEGSSKLRSLENLTHLELGLESHLYYYLIRKGCPKSLEVLKLFDTATTQVAGSVEHPLAVLDQVVNLAMNHLTTQPLDLNLVYSEFLLLRLFTSIEPSLFLKEIFRDRKPIYKIATVMNSRGPGSRFRMFRHVFSLGNSYIPPYMYGEELPQEELMYDSQDFWRFLGKDYQPLDDENLKPNNTKRLTCPRCIRRGIQCINNEDGKACLACARAHLSCGTTLYEEDDSDDNVFMVPESTYEEEND